MPPSPTPIAPGERTGVTKLENTEPRQSLENTRASRSTTRAEIRMLISVVQRSAGDDEEDVLERTPPGEYGRRLDPSGVDRLVHAVRVVGINQQALTRQLHPGARRE